MIKKSTKHIKRAKAVTKVQGTEPSKPIVTDSDILDYYNWYFHNTTAEESVEYLYKYLKDHNLFKQLAVAQSIPRYNIPNWACYMARILDRDIQLPESKWHKFQNFIETLNTKPEKKNGKKSNFREKVVNALQRQTEALLEEIEIEIDRYIENKAPEFNAYEFCMQHQIPKQAVKAAIDHINPYIEQLKLALSGKIFGYSGYTKTQVNNLYNNYVSLRNQLQSVSDQKKKQRRVNKLKKEKLPKLDKFKFKLESKDHKVVSVSPAKIGGSKMLIVFNTKYNWLGFFKAEKGSQLEVRGTSIHNYAREESFRKTYKGSLATIQNMGQREFMEFFNNLKSVPAEQRSQINEDTLLLRVF